MKSKKGKEISWFVYFILQRNVNPHKDGEPVIFLFGFKQMLV
jgi:hypothetical protein